MFYDWLTVHQDHDTRLPIISDRHFIVIDNPTGEEVGTKQPTVDHKGSFSTLVKIRISGNRITVSGNPSRFGRTENLFGLTSLDQCITIFNRILETYQLPPFTKCTRVWHGVGEDGSRVHTLSDGAIITELHLTSNKAVGQGNEDAYLRGLSSLPYRHSIPRLHTNGKTTDWLTKRGKGGRLIYPSAYHKAYELALHALPKLKRTHGETSPEYKYLKSIIDYCDSHGVVRFEQKLKNEFLRRNGYSFYGLFDESTLRPIHDEFLAIDQKLQVEAMNLETISQRLLSEGIVTSTRAANTTTLYAIHWMHGQQFDFNKRATQTHRARLRKIGIDISLTCDLSKFSLVNVKSSRTVIAQPLAMPNWYQMPAVNHLKIAA